jgi:hypothetical protein
MSTSETQQDPMNMKVEPQKEHAWLQKFVGEWTFEGDCSMGPDKPRATFSGTESVRSIGDIWIVGDGSGEMPGGGDSTTLLTLGFNPETKRFVGTWIGSMMTQLWVYDGWLDEGERILTLESEGPDMAVPGKTAMYRDVVEFESDDHRVLRSQALGDDGEWHAFMEAHYRRKQ